MCRSPTADQQARPAFLLYREDTMFNKACAIADCLHYAEPGLSRCTAHAVEQRRGKWKKRASAPGNGAAKRLRGQVNRHPRIACPVCALHFEPSSIEVDHKVPLIDGGADIESNVWAICKGCHHQKTAREATARAAQRS